MPCCQAPFSPLAFKHLNDTGKILQDKCPYYDWNEELTVDFMGRAGIDHAVLWVSSPGVHAGDDGQYGTDWGFKNVEGCIDKKRSLMEFDGLTEAQKEKILYKNAARLLGFES